MLVLTLDADFDATDFGEFQRIADQVGEDLVDQRGIGPHHARHAVPPGQHQHQLTLLGHRPQGIEDHADGSQGIHPLRSGLQAPGLDLGQVEQAIDHAQQPRSRLMRSVQQITSSLFVIQGLILGQFQRQQNAGQRGPQFMAGVGEEFALEAAGLLGHGAGRAFGFQPEIGLEPGRDQGAEQAQLLAFGRRQFAMGEADQHPMEPVLHSQWHHHQHAARMAGDESAQVGQARVSKP